jgi:hypothetical protein
MLGLRAGNQSIFILEESFMRIVSLSFLIAVLFSAVVAQTREDALEKFKDLKSQTEVLEKTILSPDKKDLEAAARENVGVFRLLPREVYDKGFFKVRGGGAYYSFYYRIPDWGYGSDLGFEGGYLQTGFQGCGLMTDLGKIALNEITKQTSGAATLVNYQNTKDSNLCLTDNRLAGSEGLKLDETVFKTRLPAIAGNTYLVRSVSYDYYDILTAFQVRRKDADGSLIVFWKQLEQFDTPHRIASQKTSLSDSEILVKTRSWARPGLFPNLQADVNDSVITLRGTIPRDRLAYAVQLANSAGAVKVINLLTIE